MTNDLLLALAAFLAGTLNTVAGGGSFLTFPALVYVGLPVVTANATSAIAVFPGYLGAILGFRKELAAFERRPLLVIALAAAIGGSVGALLLLTSSNAAFSIAVPFLLAWATAIFAFSDRIQNWATRRHITAKGRAVSVLLASIYGGYFNGGLGVLLLALFSLWGIKDIHVMNSLKSAVSLALSITSVLLFIIAGKVAWPAAIIMMAAAILGGYIGAPLARALPRSAVKAIVVIIGLVMTGIFSLRLMSGA